MEPKATSPTFNFSHDRALEAWNSPRDTYLQTHAHAWDGIATGALVFNDNSNGAEAPRVLLVQRTAHDSMPNRWEVPGGAVDAEDATILGGCARELWEETGLVARHVKQLVYGPGGAAAQVFQNSTRTKVIGKFVFEALVQSQAVVVLDENEHQAFVWATEEEVRREEVAGGMKVPFTNAYTRDIVLEGFRLRREG